MKISKILFKNKTGKIIPVELARQDGVVYDVFFIYGPPGSGKTHLCKSISDAWQLNMFHGESSIGSSQKYSDIQIEASFNDMQPINFGVPSKLSSKAAITKKIVIGNNIKNSILYYPWNRHTCVDSPNFHGEIMTNALLPLMDLSDNSIQSCCLIIDNAARGLSESEAQAYAQEVSSIARKNNNQVIMFMDFINCGSIAGSNRSFCLEQLTSNSFMEKYKSLIDLSKTNSQLNNT